VGGVGCSLLLLSASPELLINIHVIQYSGSGSSSSTAAGWSPRHPGLIHTNVAWPGVATVTHSHQLLQH